MEKTTLDDLLKFVTFTHKYQQVKRAILATGEDREENDAEHSYQLAIVAWYLISTKKYDLDLDKVIKYALVHDLVEVYAGDTPFHSKDTELVNSKRQRELDAMDKIANEFKEISDMHELIKGYEEKTDKEARFVYALDKIVPALNVFLDNGKTWKKYGMDYKLVRTKDEKVKVSPEAAFLWEEYLELLDKHLDMFP